MVFDSCNLCKTKSSCSYWEYVSDKAEDENAFATIGNVYAIILQHNKILNYPLQVASNLFALCLHGFKPSDLKSFQSILSVLHFLVEER